MTKPSIAPVVQAQSVIKALLFLRGVHFLLNTDHSFHIASFFKIVRDMFKRLLNGIDEQKR